MRRSLPASLMLVAIALVAAVVVRVLWIEPPAAAWACQSLQPPAWCPLRAAIIWTVRAGIPGFLALALGTWAFVRASRAGDSTWTAPAAMMLGAVGLGLYVPEPAAGGALLGALALVRR